MALSWVSVNINNGRIIADLPGLRVDGSLKRTLGRHESQTAILPLGASPDDPFAAPENWRDATRKKAVALVALDEHDVPVWGGMVTERTTTHGTDVNLSLATLEDYLNDRYVGDETFFTYPQNYIVQDLVNKYVKTGATPGLPIRVEILPGPNPVHGRTYLDADDKTVFAVLDELSGVIGGPEWTIGWERVGELITPVLYVGSRIGAAAPAGLGPAAQFHLPGNVQSAQLVEGYRRGEGANDVMAASSGAGDARPQSPRQADHADARPTVEYRWSPSSSITEIPTLTSHAQRALTAMKGGTLELAITANREEGPKLGTDWGLGDDIGFDLTGPAWPDGIHGTARAIGWELTNTTITPILDVTGIEGID